MPDLDIVYAQQCEMSGHANVDGYEQWNLFDETAWPYCTCKAYKFAVNGRTNFGGRMMPNPCKHIEKAMELQCGWHSMWSEIPQEEDGICPRCGGPTRIVRVAI